MHPRFYPAAPKVLLLATLQGKDGGVCENNADKGSFS